MFYKYYGAGNDFIVEDVRETRETFSEGEIAELCDRKEGFVFEDGVFGADGIMLLQTSDKYDFRMQYFNSDGSGGMMCGNGGRCMVAFADYLGIKPSREGLYVFEAADGVHTGEILSREARVDEVYERKIVRLKMIDVSVHHKVLDGLFLDTGTRHFVRFVPDAEKVDVPTEGRKARLDPVFAPVGANANFVSIDPDGALRVRTFEKGVEAETLACGTGITASAIAAYIEGILPSRRSGDSVSYDIQARRDRLTVDFVPCAEVFKDVYLTGPTLSLI